MSAIQAAAVREYGNGTVQAARDIIRESQGQDSLDVARRILAELGEEGQTLLSLCLLIWVERELSRMTPPPPKPPPAGPPVVIRPRTSTPDRIRQWYEARLDNAIACGDGTAKPLKECTAADLRAAASARMRQAEQLMKIATYMRLNDRETVAQILPDELWSLMTAAP